MADESKDRNEKVLMRHPDLDGKPSQVALTTREAFDIVWAPKGWQLEDAETAQVAAAQAAPTTPAGTPSTPPTPSGKAAGANADQGAQS